MKINKRFCPIRTTGFWKEENSKIFVASFSGEFELEGVAAIIWKLCNGKKTIEKIMHYLKEIFPEVPDETIEYDLIEFLINLEKDDLIILDYDPLFPHKKIHYIEKLNDEEK